MTGVSDAQLDQNVGNAHFQPLLEQAFECGRTGGRRCSDSIETDGAAVVLLEVGQRRLNAPVAAFASRTGLGRAEVAPSLIARKRVENPQQRSKAFESSRRFKLIEDR